MSRMTILGRMTLVLASILILGCGESVTAPERDGIDPAGLEGGDGDKRNEMSPSGLEGGDGDKITP